MLTETAKTWLEDRRISAETARRLQVASVERGGGDWIVFPYAREGKIINRKYRRIDKKAFSQDAGGEKAVWNIDALAEPEYTGPVIITEGEMDALAAIEAGFERVVSVPDGAPSEAIGDRDTAKYDYVPELLKALKGKDEIILATDGDGPGANLLEDLAYRLGRARCKYLAYPKGCKDLNDALIHYGQSGVTATIKRAKWLKVTGLVRLKELPPQSDPVLYRAGISEKLDEHMALGLGHFSVWTGVPGNGKSTLVRAIGIELAQKHGLKQCVASFEDTPADYRREVARYLNGRAAMYLKPEHYAIADDFIDQHYRFILPDYDDEPSLDWLIERMEAAAVQFGAKLFVIDPWSELDHLYGRDMSETQYVAWAIAQLRRFARRFAAHVAVIAHPAKMDMSKGKPRVPEGYDISGSAHWFNKPELGVTVHRVQEDGVDCTMVRVWKSKRHDVMGPPGDVLLELEYNSGRYCAYAGASEWDRERMGIRNKVSL